jgi:glycosyltransferase involved in cell wall biosynthesis
VKVAFVTTNLRGGGAEKAVLKIASGLMSRGHEVHLVLFEHIVEHDIDPQFRLHILARGGGAWPKGWLGKKMAAMALRSRMRKLSTARAFDLVVSTLPFADEVVSHARLPNVWYRIANTLSEEIRLLRETDSAKAERRLSRYRRVYGQANLIAVSEGVAADLRERLKLSAANIIHIYNPFDRQAIERMACEEDDEIPQEPYVIHVGRFAKQKRHDLLFEAWGRAGLAQRLVLLTAASPGLNKLIADFGLTERVTVTGFKRNPYPWIKRADLLVLCSDHEGMPNVLVEALLCSTRVVSTDCRTGPGEILTGPLQENLVPCGDAARLAHAMRAALANPGVAAPESLRAFDSDAVLAQYVRGAA